MVEVFGDDGRGLILARVFLTRDKIPRTTRVLTTNKDRPIAVALIGAAAIVIAALIGYWATHSKSDPVLVDYTGKVKDAKSYQPIEKASVAITEDQKPPQRFTTDSEGIFYARLSRDTQKMFLEVKAQGYRDYSRTGPTVRTGTEDIFLEPQRKPEPLQDSTDAELEKLRALHKVSLIRPDEVGKTLDGMPKNSYAFAGGYALNIYSPVELKIDDNHKYIDDDFEIHKLGDGHVRNSWIRWTREHSRVIV